MLFLTENYAALDILKNPKNYLSLSDELNVAQSTGDMAANDIQPFILFGSSFPKDKEYTQVSTCVKQVGLFSLGNILAPKFSFFHASLL